MTTLMSVLAVAAAVVSLVCWIMVLIKIFKDNVGLGILGIVCNLFAFIYGWVKVKEYNIKNVMLAWTVAYVIFVIAYALGLGAAFQDITQGLEGGGM